MFRYRFQLQTDSKLVLLYHLQTFYSLMLVVETNLKDWVWLLLFNKYNVISRT